MEIFIGQKAIGPLELRKLEFPLFGPDVENSPKSRFTSEPDFGA